MLATQSRRHFLAALSAAGALGLMRSGSSAEEAPPETTTIRLTKIPGICVAPQYIAEELLKTEGFSDVQYVEMEAAYVHAAFAAAKVDVSMAYVAPFIMQVDAGVPIVLLGGIHAGCFELFGTERVRTISDLKGRTVAVPGLTSPHYYFLAGMAAYVGVDPKHRRSRPAGRRRRSSSSRSLEHFLGQYMVPLVI